MVDEFEKLLYRFDSCKLIEVESKLTFSENKNAYVMGGEIQAYYTNDALVYSYKESVKYVKEFDVTADYSSFNDTIEKDLVIYKFNVFLENFLFKELNFMAFNSATL